MKTSEDKTQVIKSSEIRGLTAAQGTTVMITSMMGSGVMLLPVAMRELGYIQGPLVIVAVASLAYFTLHAMTFSADSYYRSNNVKSHQISYHSVSKDAHPILGILTDIFLVLQGQGSCICYIIGLKKFIFTTIRIEASQTQQIVCIVITSGILITISMRKDLSSLRFASYLSVLSVFYLTMLIIYLTILSYLNSGLPSFSLLLPYRTNYKSALGDIIFALGCHQNIVKVYSELQKKNMATITKVSIGAIVFGSTVYMINGFFGCLLIWDTKGDRTVLELFLSDDDRPGFMDAIKGKGFIESETLIRIGIVMLSCVLFCAYPMQLHPTRDGLESITGYHNKPVLTLVIGSIAAMAAILTDSISTVSSLIGATAINGITFGIPSAVFLKHGRSMQLRVLAYFTITFSILLMVLLLAFAAKAATE